jgi:ferric-dicitrate binding protein FerR (iron transport regulator)
MNEELQRIMTADDRLDDVARARIWSAVDDRLAAPVVVRRRRAVVIAAAVAVVAAAALAVIVGIAVVRRPDVVGRTVLSAPEASTLSTVVGHAKVALVGPARLEVVRADTASTVSLQRGTLLVQFDGGEGRSMRVEAPGMTVEVVGTLFAVEVGAVATCVSVTHGRVRVETEAAGARDVIEGQRACSNGKATPIPPLVEDALERHAKQIALAPSPPPSPSPPPPPSPAPLTPAPAPAPLTPSERSPKASASRRVEPSAETAATTET